MPELPVYVLDSFALLAHLQDESGQGRVVGLLELAQSNGCRLLISLINLGEMADIVESIR